jgi:hypothetical protein
VIYYDFFKDSAEINKKEKANRWHCSNTAGTVAKPPFQNRLGVI